VSQGAESAGRKFGFKNCNEEATMAPIRVRPTRADVLIANAIAGHTGPSTEEAAELLTWGADEHVICALAAGWWLYSRGKSGHERRVADHILITALVASALPHLLKTVFKQERPDRRTIQGHWRGVPFSGKRFDAFPSGHAVHIGALASAASRLPAKQRNFVWSVGAGLVLTRVVLLAHWASDVVIGLAVGALTERILRPLTGYGRARGREKNPVLTDQLSRRTAAD
jgi:membrane-associated phospholipid phosphatase